MSEIFTGLKKKWKRQRAKAKPLLPSSDLAGVLGIRSRGLNASCPDIENKSCYIRLLNTFILVFHSPRLVALRFVTVLFAHTSRKCWALVYPRAASQSHLVHQQDPPMLEAAIETGEYHSVNTSIKICLLSSIVF